MLSVPKVPHLLIVEDDVIWGRAVQRTFERIGWSVSMALDLENAKALLSQTSIDLCLIDVFLAHEESGFDLLEYIVRHFPQSHACILSSCNNLKYRLQGLELGAIDYLSKPIGLYELTLRLRRYVEVLLQPRTHESKKTSIEFNGFKFDLQSHVLTYQNSPIHLTPNEQLLLYHFLVQPSQKLHREFISTHILQKTWHPDDRSVDMLISHLRQKFRSLTHKILILPIRGEGYQININ